MSQEELLDVLDESGAVIGVKSRAQVHADCDWHGLVFVWSAWNQDGQAVMMMQRRGRYRYFRSLVTIRVVGSGGEGRRAALKAQFPAKFANL